MPDTGIITAASTNGGGTPSFAQRQIEIAVTLANSQQTNQPINFSGTSSNTGTFSGFRTSVRIENNGAPSGSHASVKMYGLNPDHINQLSTLGQIFNSIQKNTLVISAGTASDGLTAVFSGTINFAYPNYDEMPNVPMCFECQTGLINAVLPVPVSSFPQQTSVATILAGIANQMSIGFENNGVNVQLPPSYFPGNLLTQMRSVAEHANINAEIVDGGTKLAIWPKGGSRTSKQGNNIPLISATTGMIRSPSFAPNGYLVVKTLYNPQISFGSVVQVQSDTITQANKSWVVQKLDLSLDSLTPKGKWEAICFCYPVGLPAPPPGQALT